MFIEDLCLELVIGQTDRNFCATLTGWSLLLHSSLRSQKHLRLTFSGLWIAFSYLVLEYELLVRTLYPYQFCGPRDAQNYAKMPFCQF